MNVVRQCTVALTQIRAHILAMIAKLILHPTLAMDGVIVIVEHTTTHLDVRGMVVTVVS
jgi:hypothetical protein